MITSSSSSLKFNRFRRLRKLPQLRAMVQETRIHPTDLIAPLFIVPGKGIRNEIPSLPGQFHLSPDRAVEEAAEIKKLGIPAILLFGLPEVKDEIGSSACEDNGVVQQAIRAIKSEVSGIAMIPDLCFCEYTSHGHCGVIKNGEVQNDETLVNLQRQALSMSRAGADIIAPSGMMDGMVAAIRSALDGEGYVDVAIMSYAAKFASAYYGPFREAVKSAPSFGDRKSYQMDPGNGREALREIEEDIEQGADIVMVKPALPYLDVIARARDRFDVPLAAYNVSGEYAMIRSAAKLGLVDEEKIMVETVQSIKRAGADMIITYFAKDLAKLL